MTLALPGAAADPIGGQNFARLTSDFAGARCNGLAHRAGAHVFAEAAS